MQRADRETINGHSSGVVWFSGLPGSGKTTLALEVEKELCQRGIRCFVLDGDSLRKGLNRDLGFSDEHRKENMRRAAEVAFMFIEAGFLVLVPMISPTETSRAIVRQRFSRQDYVELYVRCSLAECERRDPKGMYRLAKEGDIPFFTGISAPYEPPVNPDLILDTESSDLRYCVNNLVNYLKMRKIINPQ